MIVTILPSFAKSESISIDVELVVQEGEVVGDIVEQVLRNGAAMPNVDEDVLEEGTVANDPLNIVVLFVEVVKLFELEVEVVVATDVGIDACAVELHVDVLRIIT